MTTPPDGVADIGRLVTEYCPQENPESSSEESESYRALRALANLALAGVRPVVMRGVVSRSQTSRQRAFDATLGTLECVITETGAASVSLTRAGLDVRGDRYGHEKYLGPCRARVLVFAVAGAQTPFRETFPPRKR